MRIKRWFFTALLGVIIVGGGFVAFASSFALVRISGIIIVICGIVLIVMGTGKMIVSILTLFLPRGNQELVNILYQRRYLERGPKVVAVGGGHGLSNLLMGLKEYTANLTAIVTVADSGGSSGRLRQEFNIVAPGDIRMCMVALADAPALMGELFQFRFKTESQLQGHNFGNLFLTAMVQVTGDFERAVEEAGKILAIRGKVVPSTTTNVQLVAEYEDGSFMEGEARIPESNNRIRRVYLEPGNPQPTKAALEAIRDADVVVLGPGSIYTSIIPNLVIKEISDALAASQAFKIYVCNVMTQHGESDSFTASDHVRQIIEHSHKDVINACLINDAQVPLEAQERYKAEGSFPVKPDVDQIRAMGYLAFGTDLLSVSDYIRHDSEKLTKSIINLIERYKIIKR